MFALGYSREHVKKSRLVMRRENFKHLRRRRTKHEIGHGGAMHRDQRFSAVAKIDLLLERKRRRYMPFESVARQQRRQLDLVGQLARLSILAAEVNAFAGRHSPPGKRGL